MSFRILDERDINSIKGKLKGSVVRADDVLPAEHNIDVKVKSKNIAIRTNANKTVITEGITYTVNDDGTISATGTATGTAYYLMLGNTTYETQIPIKKGIYTVAKSPAEGCRVSIGLRENSEAVRVLYYSTHQNTVTFEVKSDTARFDMILCVDTGYTITDVVFKPQMEEGNTATEYTPYVDPASVTLSRCGKNILGFKESFSLSQNGLDVEYDAESQIFTINGTPKTASYSMRLGNYMALQPHIEVGKNYCLSLKHISGTVSEESITNVFYLGSSKTADGQYSNWIATRFTNESELSNIKKAEKGFLTQCWIYTGEDFATFTDYKFKIQVEQSDTATGYEDFSVESVNPSSEGKADILTTSPTMTLFTDKEGVIIECEYNKDANAVIEKLTNAIIALGGTV